MAEVRLGVAPQAHRGGRVCRLYDDGVWRYGTGFLGGPWICPDHPRDGISVGALKVSVAEQPTVTLQYRTEAVKTEEARRILTQVPNILEDFIKNNAKYAHAQDVDLGDRGIIPDINRKTSVLIARIWHNEPVVGEGTVQVVDDLIGHLLLLRDKLIGEADG